MKVYSLALVCLLQEAVAFVVFPNAGAPKATVLKSTADDDTALWMASGLAEAPGAVGAIKDDSALTEIWENTPAVRVEGQSLRTWTVDHKIDMHHVSLKTEGRPLTAKIDLWHGPDYTPNTLKLYIEDGLMRPFHAIVATPLTGNTIAVYNEASLEYPFDCVVEGDTSKSSLNYAPGDLYERLPLKNVQGGMIVSYSFDSDVDSVEILLKTDGRNLKGRIELLTGPNNIKQVMDYYSSNGKKRPFYAVIQTPGPGNVVRIINENTIEYPFGCIVEPYITSED